MHRHLTILLFLFAFVSQLNAQTDCGWNPDYDGDFQVGVADLLGLLGVFEEQDSDEDGIWDSQDDCVGTYDECGECNGPGPQILGIDTIIVYYDSLYAEAIDEWWVFEVGADTLLTYLCENPGCMDSAADNFDPYAIEEDNSCVYANGSPVCNFQTSLYHDGYYYDLVAIGDQCWFAENLRTEHYANGEAIPGNLSDSEWTSTTFGAQAVYDNDDENLATYGRLYNWYAVDDARGLCPGGWHVPTDGEWTELTDFLGGSTVAGNSMKSSLSDSPAWNGTNASGFSALPGGLRSYGSGNFLSEGNVGCWWSASPVTYDAWYRYLSSGNGSVIRVSTYTRSGFSVRCVRD